MAPRNLTARRSGKPIPGNDQRQQLMGIWRCLHPRLLFQENLTLILGSLLFLMGMGITIAFSLSTQTKPQASQAVFTMILLPAFFIVAGFLIHYWRMISEDLLRILPGFRRQAIGIFVSILVLLLVIIAGEMRFSNIPLAGAFILTAYVAFWAAFYAILINIGGSRRKDRKYWQGFPLLPVYPLIFFPPARNVFLAIPAPVDSVLGILLLLLIVLLMRKTPREWQVFYPNTCTGPRIFASRTFRGVLSGAGCPATGTTPFWIRRDDRRESWRFFLYNPSYRPLLLQYNICALAHRIGLRFCLFFQSFSFYPSFHGVSGRHAHLIGNI